MDLSKHLKISDITEDEEAKLPLPSNWVRLFNSESQNYYKNLSNGIESEEHPFILSALIAARKMKLEPGWVVREASLSDGSSDYFYCNPTLGISMWDPPFLRRCLADILGANGFSAAALWVLYEDSSKDLANALQSGSALPSDDAVLNAYNQFVNSGIQPMSIMRAQPLDVENSEADEIGYKDNGINAEIAKDVDSDDHNQISSTGNWNEEKGPRNESDSYLRGNFVDPRNYEYLKDDRNDIEVSGSNRQEPQNNNPVIPGNGVSLPQEASKSIGDGDDESGKDASNDDDESDLSSLPSRLHEKEEWARQGRSKKWLELRQRTYEKESIYVQKTHRMSAIGTKPPKTLAGIRVLTQDIRDSNSRVHDLLLRIRISLAKNASLDCNIFGLQNMSEAHSPSKDLMALASSIIATIRRQPERVVATMGKCYVPGDSGMINMAFVVLHRLLHPMSTDYSLTTALLLQGFTYQLNEAVAVEEMFSDMDSKMVVSRAIFINDPDAGFQWNPLAQPMPVVPNVPHEPVLVCLLRVYAVRRDVTSFFRTVWRPVVPSVIAIVDAGFSEGPHIFMNLVAAAIRLLDCTLDPRILVSFPPVATAMCRAAHEVGDAPALHAYLFDLLILPNLVKVFKGDHDSIENEYSQSPESIPHFVNQYYDLDVWWPINGYENADYDAINYLIWLVWRLYTGAAFLDEPSIEVITTAGFFSGGPNMDMSGVPDQRLKIFIHRLQMRIERGIQCLLHMPLDSEGSSFLGIDQASSMENAAKDPELAKHMDHRLIALLLKPQDMLTYTVVSRREIKQIFRDLGEELESSGQSNTSLFYRTISEYLVKNEEFGDIEGMEEIMFLTAPDSDADSIYDELSDLPGGDPQRVVFEYDQLARGLQLANRYEDTLLHILKVVDAQVINSIRDLLEDNPCYVAPEFDANFKVVEVKLYDKTTKASQLKVRSAHHGLAKPRVANQAVEPALAIIPHQEEKSSKALFNEMHKTLRFGSSEPNAEVGTSIARAKVMPPKVGQTIEADDWNHRMSYNRYTRFEVDNNEGFMAPTESYRHQYDADLVTRHDIAKKFLTSMRGYDIIPTDEFLNRRRRKSRASTYGQRQRQQAIRRSHSGDSSAPLGGRGSSSSSAPKPFPDHLRHLIRPVQGQQQQQLRMRRGGEGDGEGSQSSHVGAYFDDDDMDELQASPGMVPGPYQISEYDQEGFDDFAAMNADGDAKDPDFAKLINSYQSIFAAAKPITSLSPYFQRSNNNNSNSNSHLPKQTFTGVVERGPKYIETSGKAYMTPTASLLNRFREVERDRAAATTARFYNDLDQGIPPNLRATDPHKQRSVSPDPFVPVGAISYDGYDFAESRGELTQMPSTSATGSAVTAGRSSRSQSRGRSRSQSRSPGAANSQQGRRSQQAPKKQQDQQGPPSAERSGRGDRHSPAVAQPADGAANAVGRPASSPLSKKVSPVLEHIEVDGSGSGSDAEVAGSRDGQLPISRQQQQQPQDLTPPRRPRGVDSSQQTSAGPKLPPAGAGGLYPLNIAGSDSGDASEEAKAVVPPTLARKTVWNKADLKVIMKNGFIVKKYGQTGFPKLKILSYLEGSHELQWAPATKDAPWAMLFGGRKEPSRIPMSTIMAIRRGLGSEVLVKAKHVDPGCCLVVISATKTLNLVFKSAAERDMAANGFDGILRPS